MSGLLMKIFRIVPFLALLYSLWLLYEILGILHDKHRNYFFFLFLSFQVYINWITIICVPTNCSTVVVGHYRASDNDDHERQSITVNLLNNEEKTWNDEQTPKYESAKGSNEYSLTKLPKKGGYSSVEEDFDVDTNTVWYCPKCCQRSSQNCHHCPVCNKCVVERDHHCFFVGTCIAQKNMKHFIVFLVYTSLTCFYSLYLICEEMNLFQGVVQDWTVIIFHFLPVAFAQFIGGEISLHNLLRVTLLDTSATLALFSLAFALHHMYLILAGKMIQRLQRKHIGQRRRASSSNPCTNFSLIFGSYGIINFIMPVGFARNVLKIHLQ